MAPSIYAMSLHFGAVGAASIWLLLNLINLAVGLPLTHRRLLPGEALCWLFEDVAPPLAVSVAMMGFARGFLTTDPSRRFFNALELSGLLLVVVALTASATPVLRTWMAEQWKDFRNQNA
jgi:hypothetical protein